MSAFDPAPVLRALLRNSQWVCAVLVEAHFDESGTHAKEITIAGYLFESDRVPEFCDRWNAVLNEYGLPYLHMVDFAPGVNEYAHLKNDPITRSAIQTRLMRVLRRYSVNGIVINMENDTNRRGKSYFKACERAARTVITWANNTTYDGNIAYFFERGATGQGLLDEFFARLDDSQRKDFRCVSHSFLEKAGNPTVQAADLLAWLYQNYTKRRKKRDLARLNLRYLLRTPHLIVDDLGEPPRKSRCESISASHLRFETVYYLPRGAHDPKGGNLIAKADITIFSGQTKGSILACPVCKRAVCEDVALGDFWTPNNVTPTMQLLCYCGTWCSLPKVMVPLAA